LGQAFATAIGLVLDHSYRTQGGYKMSPAEIRTYANAAKKSCLPRKSSNNVDSD
jgi:hypothetical protein